MSRDDFPAFTSDNPYHQPGAFAGNQFAGLTHKLPRPDRDQPNYAHLPAHELKRQQGLWDFADGARIEREQWLAGVRKEQAAKAAEDQRRRDDQAKAKSDAQRAETLAMLRKRFLATPGATEADWAKRDPDTVFGEYAHSRMLSGEAGDPDAMARVAHARTYRDW